MAIKDKISEIEKAIEDNTNQIQQLNAIINDKIAYGNKLFGKLEAYQELLKESEENNEKKDKDKSEQDD